MNMLQVNNIPNDRQVFLDLIFSNVSDVTVSRAVDNILPNSVHHIAYCFNINLQFQFLPIKEYYFDFRGTNYLAVNDFLASVDWEECFRDVDVCIAAEKFHSIVNECLSLYVPRKLITTSKVV